MANQKVYVGKIGSQTLYARIKSEIERIKEIIKNFGGFVVVPLNNEGVPDPSPDEPKHTLVYLTKIDVTGDDKYKEWIYNQNDEWEIIGDTSVDLSQYYTKDETDTLLDTKLNISDYHDTTYTAGNGLTLTSTEFKITPGTTDDGYFTTQNNQVVWVSDQFVDVEIPSEPGSVTFRFIDKPEFDPSTSLPESYTMYGTTTVYPVGNWEKVSGSSYNDWTWTYDNTDWSSAFYMRLDKNTTGSVQIIDAQLGSVEKLMATFASNTAITSVSSFHAPSVTNMSSTFAECRNLTSVDLPSLPKVESLVNCFARCSVLTSVSIGDTPNLTDISFLFDTCTSLTSLPYINTSKVTNIRCVLQSCRSLTTLNDFIRWDLSNVEQMDNAFKGCTEITTMPSITVPKVTTLNGVWNGCSNLKTVNPIVTGQLTQTNEMFRWCYELTTLPYFDLSHVTTAYQMFLNCESLSGVPDYDYSNIEIIHNAFAVTHFSTIPSNLNFAKATNASSLFASSWVTEVPENLKFPNALDVSYMFDNCQKLTKIRPIIAPVAENVDEMFAYTPNVQYGVQETYNYLNSLGSITSHSKTFRGCGSNTSQSTVVNSLPSSWR